MLALAQGTRPGTPNRNEVGDAWPTEARRHPGTPRRSSARIRGVPGRRAARHGRRARPAGQDALLLLRPAVRHPAQGEGQRGRSASSRGRTSRSTRGCSAPRASSATCRARTTTGCSTAYCRDPSAPSGFRADRRTTRRSQRVAVGDRAHPGDATATTPFAVLGGREPDDREELPDGQVRPRLPEDAAHRLQRPALHGQRRRPATRRRSASTARQPVGDILGAEVIWIGGAERRRVRADHHQLRLAGPRERARRSSSSIRASRRSRAPATCSCRSSPGATRRCSPASCT